MSELDQLRELLIAKGMEYREHEAPATDCIAFFDGNGWHDCWESVDGEVNVTFSMTPAQAIAATLGRGTCHMRLVYEEEDADGFIWPDHYECDACGANVNGIMPSYDTEIQPHFCPNCGREVTDG